MLDEVKKKLEDVIGRQWVFPRPMGNLANPEVAPELLRSTWVVVDVSRALTYFLGAWGFTLFLLLGIALALVPFFHRTAERSILRRPRAAAVGLLFILIFLLSWAIRSRLQAVPASLTESTAAASTDSTVPAADLGKASPRPDSTPAPGEKR